MLISTIRLCFSVGQRPPTLPSMRSRGVKALPIRAYLTRLIWLCVLPLVLLAFYLAFQHVESLQFQLDREAADRARDATTAIDSKIKAQIAGLQLLAASSLAEDTSHLKEFYEEALGFRESFGGHVVLADLSLQMRFNTRVPFGTTLPKLPRPKGHAAAPAVLATGKPAVGDMFPGPIAMETLVAVVVPVIRGGATKSLLLSTIETGQFQQLVDNLTLPRGWSLTLLDGKSEVMARRASGGSEGLPGGEKPPRRIVANSTVSPWSVVVEIPRSVHRAPIVRAVTALAVAILAISFISILVGSQAARRLARSVASLTATRSPEYSRPVIAEVEEIRGVLAEAAESRKAADSALREQDRFIAAIADTSPAILYVYDMTTGSYVYANAGITRLLGYSPAEVQALGVEVFGRLIHPDDLPGVIAFQSRMLTARDEDVLETEYRMRHRDGAWFTLHSYERPFNRNPDGSVRQKIGIAIDISERKRAEEGLRESEERYRNLLETAPVGIAVHSEGKIVFTNLAGARLLGADTEDQIVGKRITEIIHPAGLPEAQSRIQRMMAGERGLYPAEDVYLRLDGTPVNVEVMATLLTYQGRPAVQVIVTDITERKQAEERLRNLNRVYRILSEINKAIVRIPEPQAIFNEACRIAVQEGGFLMAWVGLVDEAGGKVEPVASAGDTGGYLERLRITLGDGPHGSGPTAIALRAGKHELCNDIQDDPRMAPWREDALRLGYRASVALPLIVHGKVRGTFNLYAGKPGFFVEEEMRLLDELAANISFAMEMAEREELRQQAEKALRVSEANLRKAQEIAKLGSWLIDLSDGTTSWSEEMYRIYGVSPETFTPDAESFINLILPDDRPAMDEWIRAYFAREGPDEVEFRVVRPDGTIHFISAQGGVITGADGRLTHLAGTAHDITERKQAEKALRESTERLSLLVEGTGTGLWDWDLATNQVHYSHKWKQLLGYEEHEVADHLDEWRRLTHPDDIELTLAKVNAFLEQPRGGLEVEFRMRHKSGAYRWILSRATVRIGGDGKPAHLLGYHVDITDRKRAEEELLRSEAEFRRLSQEFNGLLDAIPDSLALIDTDLKVLWANRAAVETVGMTAEEVAGRHCYALWHNRASACDPCPVARTFTTGESQSETVTGTEGSIWDIRTVPLVDAQGRATRVIEVKRDITEHRRLEEQLRQAQKLEGIGQLAGGIAHDFNNVLGVVIGFAGILQMRIAEGDPLRHYADEIVLAGERGAELTRQILAFSRKQVVDLKPARLNDVVRGLEKMLRRLLPESIDIVHDLSGEDLGILADASQLGQVLINLVSNARDAIVGSGKIGIATERSAIDRSFVDSYGYGEPGEYAVLTVSDSGHGMDEVTRARIFEPFFTTKELGKGTGLGMAVVHGIVKQHRGFVNVYSEVGKGTVVRIYLPLTAGAGTEGLTAPAEAPVVGGSETILVAEDDVVLRKLSRAVLGQHGYTVIDAEDGQDAVAKFAANKDAIRLVILDGLMPKMGGVEALAEIRRLNPGVKALFMSGYDDNIFSKAGLRNEAAFIQKPVMPVDLLRKVREVLDG